MEATDELRDQVIAIINNTVNLTEEEVTRVVTHLFSSAVMLRTFEELKYVRESVLEEVIGSVPAVKLLEAFHKATNSDTSSSRENQPSQAHNQNNSNTSRSEENRSSQAHNQNNSNTSRSEENRRSLAHNQNISNTSRSEENRRSQAHNQDNESEDIFRRLHFNEGEFSFTVNWNDLPKKTLKNLATKNKEEKEGNAQDIKDLKLAIGNKMLLKWAAFRESHQQSGKLQYSPGAKACKDVAIQVVSRYRFAMRDVLNGVVHGKGILSLTKSLVIRTQNKTRPDPPTETGVMRGKGLPGIIADEYKPSMTKAEKLSQSRIQKELLEMAVYIEEEDRDWKEIIDKMNETYELQRELIVEVTKAILGGAEAEDEAEEETEDNPQEKMIEKVKNKWPFLFTLKPMHSHHKRLTGRDLEGRLNTYMADAENLHFLLLFLTSSSAANFKNVVLNEKVKKSTLTNGSKLLLATCMLANHFKEDYKSFLLPVERTTALDEVLTAIPDLPSSICIIGLGDNALVADHYYIALDQVGVVETKNAGNALLMLIELCFIFDIQYPTKLTRTFEFIERIILEMTVEQSRVRDTKGKILLVLSEAVRSLGKKLTEFTDQMKENLRESN